MLRGKEDVRGNGEGADAQGDIGGWEGESDKGSGLRKGADGGIWGVGRESDEETRVEWKEWSREEKRVTAPCGRWNSAAGGGGRGPVQA